jgi:hypothetical protein
MTEAVIALSAAGICYMLHAICNEIFCMGSVLYHALHEDNNEVMNRIRKRS